MRKTIFLITLFVGILTASAQQIVKPKFQGSDLQRFMTRLVGEMKRIALEAEDYPAEGFSDEIVFRCEVDTAGGFRIVRFLDDTCEGNDFRNVPPATLYTREATVQAATRLERWTPAVDAQGRPIVYPMTLRLSLPVRQIHAERSLKSGNCVLFNGGDPNETFPNWLHPRTGDLAIGRYHVKIWIESDGSISEVETIEAPSDKAGRRFARIIRASSGKWSPERPDGTPTRSSYEYRLNMHSAE